MSRARPQRWIRPLLAVGLLLLGATLTAPSGCSEAPREGYDDFLTRTRSLRDVGVDAGYVRSRLADLRGRWFMRSLLMGGYDLGLRMDFEWAEGEDGEPPVDYVVTMWHHTQPLGDTPMLVSSTQVQADGTFDLIADPLLVGAEVTRSDARVVAIATMHSRTPHGDNWCGNVTGKVISPLEIDITGSQFSAERDDDRTMALDQLDYRCADDREAETPPTDAGVTDASLTDAAGPPPRPEAPDLGVTGVATDLSGHWLLQTMLAGALPLQLWMSLVWAPARTGPDGGLSPATIDGALRQATGGSEDVVLANFSTTVQPDGSFEVWVPGFALEVGPVHVGADILLVAASLDDGLCGAVAGAVHSPMELDLAGSTFAGVRWTPGDEIPEGLPAACP